MSNSIIIKSTEILGDIRIECPLTHCITNVVTVRDCANAVLAVGGSPIMANEPEEANEVTSICNSLLVNIGTLTTSQVEAMKKSVQTAKDNNIPYVLDPVGIGISEIRNKTPIDLINIEKPVIIRGNLSEIKTIAMFYGILDECSKVKGVDVADDDTITDDNVEVQAQIVKNIAKKLETVIAASGKIDIISDGEDTYLIDNGVSMMSNITGSGCMLGALMANLSAITEPLIAAISATIIMDISGEIALTRVQFNNRGTGSFGTYLIDELSLMDTETLVARNNVKKI